MRASKKLIQAICAFGASLVLCIGACAAWFVNNFYVSSGDIEGAVGSHNIRDFSVTAYNLDVDGDATASAGKTVYTVGEENTEVSMHTYGDFTVDTTALLLEIKCELEAPADDAYRIHLVCSDEVQSVTFYDGEEYNFECNLSDAVCFYGVDYAGGTISEGDNFSFGAKSSFLSSSGMSVTKNGIMLDDYVTESKTIYIVIDYDTSYINSLYSNALSMGGSLNSTMKFKNDIYFNIDKG